MDPVCSTGFTSYLTWTEHVVEKIVTLFFKNLRVCNIEPCMVLDARDDVRGNKFDTLKKI